MLHTAVYKVFYSKYYILTIETEFVLKGLGLFLILFQKQLLSTETNNFRLAFRCIVYYSITVEDKSDHEIAESEEVGRQGTEWNIVTVTTPIA